MINADLWRELDTELRKRESGSVLFTKVKGHATAADVLAGRTTILDKYGNDKADELAVAGAFSNQAQKQRSAKCKQKLYTAMQVQ